MNGYTGRPSTLIWRSVADWRQVASVAATPGPIAPVTVRLARIHGSEELILPHAERLAEIFFRVDVSSRGADSYDRWIADTPQDRLHRLVPEDVAIINRTMGARSKLERWTPVLEKELPALRAVDPSWDLLLLPPETWAEQRVDERIDAALDAVLGPYLNVSVVTKILHLKRPRLIPVCDRLVAEQLGCSVPASDRAASLGFAMRVIRHLREQGRRNIDELQLIRRHLAARGIERSLVRILDALLWCSHVGSWYYPFLAILDDWR